MNVNYSAKLAIRYDTSDLIAEITTTEEVKQILTTGEKGSELRDIVAHSKIPNSIRLTNYVSPDRYVGDDLKLYTCQQDHNRPYTMNLPLHGVNPFGEDLTVKPYIIKKVICGAERHVPAVQVECADGVIYCPSCKKVFK